MATQLRPVDSSQIQRRNELRLIKREGKPEVTKPTITEFVDGSRKVFSTHKNGGGLVEEGRNVAISDDVYISAQSRVLAKAEVHADVAAIYGKGTNITRVYKQYYD
ncbi:MAG: hypothetical protein KGH64_02460 [Candidatus Micrarchaeota archaeon]|nr:hypothetical protein [Candidatus Micrarchaeota archaeon]MDE1834177.1 hypothetical protein [Candidatus Micrarchaeota archaeon]MDE1859697.1 hypothetical protein [Candidatus Micrarchaeota archaeon]